METKAFRIYKFVGTGEMKWETVDVPKPGRGEVLLRHTVVGLNLADTYRRTGLYPMPLPNGWPVNRKTSPTGSRRRAFQPSRGRFA